MHTLRTMFLTDYAARFGMSPRAEATAMTAHPAYVRYRYKLPAEGNNNSGSVVDAAATTPAIRTAIPPNMWRREILDFFAPSISSSSSSSSPQQRQAIVQTLLHYPDVATNTDDVPKVLLETNVHHSLGLGRAMCESIRGHAPASVLGAALFHDPVCHTVDFNECIMPNPQSAPHLASVRIKKSSPVREVRALMPTFFIARKRSGVHNEVSELLRTHGSESPEAMETAESNRRPNEDRMREATQFGFSNVIEEARITDMLDSIWRRLLHVSTRRNVHLYVRLEMLEDCDVVWDPRGGSFHRFYRPVCFALQIRQHQEKRLLKLLRYEAMRAAGLLPRGNADEQEHDDAIVADETLSFARQRRYFVDGVEEEVLAPIRRKWNATAAAFSEMVRRYPDGAYHLRNARNMLVNDVHVAARRYIRTVLLKNNVRVRNAGQQQQQQQKQQQQHGHRHHDVVSVGAPERDAGAVEGRAIAIRRVGELLSKMVHLDALNAEPIQEMCRRQKQAQAQIRSFRGKNGTAAAAPAPARLGFMASMCVVNSDPIHPTQNISKLALSAMLAPLVHLDEQCA
jgi:hypothetical protein